MLHKFTVDNDGIHLTSTYNELDAKVRQEWALPYAKARMYAAEVVPGPTHMDMWEASCSGFKEAYPGLIGKGESAKDPFTFTNKTPVTGVTGQRVPCASNPDLVKILTVVMTNLAAQKASEVMVWMSEYPAAQCECEKCMKEGQYRAEVRSTLEAWKEARKTYPDLKVSVFFGMGGYWSSPELRYPLPRGYPDQEIKDIVASLPPDATMRASWGCDGPDGKLLADFAAKGKRIARFNVAGLSSSFRSDDIRRCMEEIVSGKYIGAWQFTSEGPSNTNADNCRKTYNYRASALAEYSWNSKGRSAKEFAEAWAVRQGYKDPAKFVAWMDAMTMPQADRVDRCWPWPRYAGAWFKSENLTNMVAQKKWNETYFKPGEPEAGIKQSERALALAEELGGQDLILKSRLMLAYCRLEQAGYQFISKLQDTTLEGAAQEKAAGEAFAQLKDACHKYVQARIDVAVSSSFTGAWAMSVFEKRGLELEAELDKVSAELAKKK